MFDHSEKVNELASALAKAQADMKPAVKNAKNPFYKSNYATLDALWESVRKPLGDNGLSVIQTLGWIGSTEKPIPTLTTTLLHSSGQWVSDKVPMSVDKDTPQAWGSATSYFRRYSLGAIVGQVTEDDDDGEAAMPNVSRKTWKVTTSAKHGHTTDTKESPFDRAWSALEKIDNGLDLASWRARFNKAVKENLFTDDGIADLEAAYAVKSEAMSEGHHD